MFSNNHLKRTFQSVSSSRNLLVSILILVTLMSLIFVAIGSENQSNKAEAAISTESSRVAQSTLEASVAVKVQVPTNMRTSPFNVDRYLTVPPNFNISVYARIPNAPFMAVAPNGDVLVSRPGGGEVKIIQSVTKSFIFRMI